MVRMHCMAQMLHAFEPTRTHYLSSEMTTITSRLVATAFARHMHLSIGIGLGLSGILLMIQTSIEPFILVGFIACVFFGFIALRNQTFTFFPTWLYLILFFLVFIAGSLFTRENGMSYWYPVLAAHVMFNQPKMRQRALVLAPASLLFIIHLAQPQHGLALFTTTIGFTFAVTVVALLTGFILVGFHASRLQRLWQGYKIQSEAMSDYLTLVRESSIVLARLRYDGEAVTMNERAEALFYDLASDSLRYPMGLAAAVDCAIAKQTVVSFSELLGSVRYQFRVMPSSSDETVTVIGEDLSDNRGEGHLSKVLFDAIECTADAAMVVDAQLLIQYNNRATATMLGFDNPDQLIGSAWLNLWPENERDRLKTRILNKLKVNTTWCGVIFCLRQDGQRERVVMSLTRVRDGSLICKLFSQDIFAITEDGLRLTGSSALTDEVQNALASRPKEVELPISPSPLLAQQLPLHILVVDDDEINRQLATYMFAKMGYSVDLAENGAVGLARCQEVCYDLILMDLHMPIMSGLEATAAIKRLRDYHPTVIAATADPIKNSAVSLAPHGIDGLLVKPFRTSELEEIIRRIGANQKNRIQTSQRA